ncbi:MAG TPA: bifunctional molybdenum cofactor biosynthesis protein MoaC/MoaB [Candidatus Obscuribacterales bacterium]
MRDISHKVASLRTAEAKAVIRVSPETLTLIRENRAPKGNPLDVARVAAIQAAKNTSQIIPYCHPIPVEFVGVEFEMKEQSIEIVTRVKAIYRTGVEMEAMTAASVAALTIYDMLKIVDDFMTIETIALNSKTGGKSDFSQKPDRKLKAAVLVLSDSAARHEKKDICGKLIMERLTEEGFDIAHYAVVTDDEVEIAQAASDLIENHAVDLLVTTGGTGISPRDNAPEAIKGLIEKELPGVAESMRAYGQERNPYAMFSRSLAGVMKDTLIVCLPGSRGGVEDGLNSLFPFIFHAFKVVHGEGHPHADKERLKA